MAATASQRDDVQPVANENLDRFLTGTITVLPILALGVVALAGVVGAARAGAT